jgi:hypothetical protein
MQTWCVVGLLHDDGRVEIQPGYTVDKPAPRRPPREVPALPQHGMVQLVGRDGSALVTQRLPLAAVCPHPPPDGRPIERTPPRAFQASVPLLDGVVAARFLFDGRVAHELKVSRHRPEVTLHWQPDGHHVEGKHVIRWEGRHAEGLPLHYTLLFSSSGGRRWVPRSLSGPATSATLDFARQPGGACLLAVVATDGFNTTWAHSRPFTLPIKPCRAIIHQPLDGARASAEHPVLLVGQGHYLEEDEPERRALSWASSLDGSLGVGGALRVRLRPGAHVITLSAGVGSRVGSAEVRLEVLPGPTA